MASHRLLRIGAFIALALFLSLMLCTTLGLAPSRNDPFHAPYIDNQMHSIAANSDTWFRFDYGFTGPPRTIATLRMVNGVANGPNFQVWAPEIMSEWWQEKPTGEGMVLNVDCNTGVPIGSGGCQSPDLMWIGAFGSEGTYYVRVINNNPAPMNFLLTVQGTSVSPAPPSSGAAATQVAVPTPSRTSAVAALPTPLDDPFHSAPIDGLVHTLPGNSATWYHFDYEITDTSVPRPRVGLRLVGAVGTGVGFQVWPPEKLNQWWLGQPVGRGTLEFSYDCPTTEVPTPTPSITPQPTLTSTPTSTPAPTSTPGPTPQCTHTPTTNLTWFGGFGVSGTYYVRIVNTNPFAANYQLTTF